MNKQTISFSANEQILKKTAGQECFADDVVGYIEAHFDLGDNWSGYDSIRAVWFTAFAQISTVLDQDGVCLVPPEVCNRQEAVNVNLVGSIVENDELTDRLTTYPIVAFIFDGNARVDGSETVPVTPSQFEQYVAIVEALVGSVKDIDHATLNADYTLTIYYSDGTSDTVGPIRGEQGPTGPTGNGIASIAKTGTSGTNPVVDTYTITYTNGQTTTFTVTNGVKGDTGVGIQSIYKTGSSGAVDTYTILYTDGNTTEFTVTNGEVTNAVLAAAIQQAKEDLVDQFAVKDTASGTIASFPDGADWPAKNVLADINPIQSGSGTPSPDNIRPISGWTECVTEVCGVNVWDEEWEVGTIASGNNIPSTISLRSKNHIPIVADTDYYFNFGGADSYEKYIFFYDADKNFLSYVAKTGSSIIHTPSNCRYVRFAYGYYIQAYTTYQNDISINYPSTDHDYHAYNGNTYTTALGRTVYGGTLDVVSGELVVKTIMIPPEKFAANVIKFSDATGYFWYSTLSTFELQGIKALNAGVISNRLVKHPNVTQNVEDGTAAIYANGIIRWKEQGELSQADYRTYLASNPLQLCYELAEPITYQLTPTEVDLLLGANNVWADTGDIEVTYVADTKLYIDKMTA